MYAWMRKSIDSEGTKKDLDSRLLSSSFFCLLADAMSILDKEKLMEWTTKRHLRKLFSRPSSPSLKTEWLSGPLRNASKVRKNWMKKGVYGAAEWKEGAW